MYKDSKKNLVGQPVFKQIIKMIPKERFDMLVHDGLRTRDEELFRLLYFVLILYFAPFLSVSRKKKYGKEGVGFDDFHAFDSTTIPLFSDIMKGVGRNPKSDGKKKEA